MKIEPKLERIDAALWCFDFENIPPLEDDKQKIYLYAFSTLLKKYKKGLKSINVIERFKARKNLIELINLWDKTVETEKTIKGRSSEVVVINKITFPPADIYVSFVERAKRERAKTLEEELSQKINERDLESRIKQMKAVFNQKGFNRLVPAFFDQTSTYLYAFHLLLQKNEQSLSSPEKLERLHAKKNINILAALWEKNVDTYHHFNANRGSYVVIVENVKLPEKEEYDKFVKTAFDWKSKNDAQQTAQAKEIRERK